MELMLYAIGGFLVVVVPAFLYGFFKNGKNIGRNIKNLDDEK